MNNKERSQGGNIPVKGGAGAAPAKVQQDKMGTTFGPAFVEAERMFERMAELTKQVANRAFEFFTDRGGELGRDLDDWFKAETEILRPAPVEMTETEKEVKVRASVAGFKPEEIEISVKDQRLMLSGKTESSKKTSDEKTFYSEWKSNHFYRDLALPQEVDADNAKANLKDGVLEIALPKAKVREAKRVSIH